MAKTIYELRRRYERLETARASLKSLETAYAALQLQREEFARRARELSDDVTEGMLRENGFKGSKFSLLPVLEEMHAGLTEMLGEPEREEGPAQPEQQSQERVDYKIIAGYVGKRPATSEQIYNKAKADFPQMSRQQFGALLAHAAHPMREHKRSHLKVVERGGRKLYCASN